MATLPTAMTLAVPQYTLSPLRGMPNPDPTRGWKLPRLCFDCSCARSRRNNPGGPKSCCWRWGCLLCICLTESSQFHRPLPRYLSVSAEVLIFLVILSAFAKGVFSPYQLPISQASQHSNTLYSRLSLQLLSFRDNNIT